MYTLVDAKKKNIEHPNSFEIPSKAEINSLKSGDYVKLIFEEEGANSERMWVKIMSIGNDNFHGVLMNDPFNLTSIKDGDLVVFNSKNIIEVIYENRRRIKLGWSDENEHK